MADSCDIPRAPGDAFPPFPAGQYPPAFRAGSRPGGFSAFSGKFIDFSLKKPGFSAKINQLS